MKLCLRSILFAAWLALLLTAQGISQEWETAGPLKPNTVKPSVAGQTGPSGLLSTLAGDGYAGDNGNGGLATKAQLILPTAVAVDSSGNVYIADPYAETIRVVAAASGMISVYAGSGVGGYAGDNKAATSAELNQPSGIAVDSADNLYIADTNNNVIRKVTKKTGIITTVAGNGALDVPGGEFQCGARVDGVTATTTTLCGPTGIAVDSAGNIYIADQGFNVVRKVNATNGLITTVAGNGQYGYTGDGSLATNAAFGYPQTVAVDSKGNIYIADADNCAIRKVTAATGDISSVVGKAQSGGYGGVCSLSGDGGLASEATINYPTGVTVDGSGNVFIADSDNGLVRMVSASDKKIYTVAGEYANEGNFQLGEIGYAGDGGPATSGLMNFPEGLALDSTGDLYIADHYNSAIREVTGAAALPSDAPVISPAGGAISGPTSVSITSPVSGTIYYTTNGSIPTTSSTRYTGPFTISNTTIVEAFSTSAGQLNSTVARANLFYAPAPAITPGTQTITAPVSVTVKEANSQATVYYTTDWSGVDPRTSSTAVKYTGPVSVNTTTSFRAAAWVTTKDASGNTIGGWSPVTTVNYLWAPAPTISVGTKSFTGSFTVTLADVNPHVQLYYSTDGTTPSMFTKDVQYYTAPFTISSSTQLKAEAWTYSLDGNGNPVSAWSPVTVATYTLTGAPAVTTSGASGVTSSGAVLNGTVTPNTGTAQYWFSYGTAINALNNNTAKTGSLTGTTAKAVSATLSGLSSKTTYYFRLNASNATGTTVGLVASFTTN